MKAAAHYESQSLLITLTPETKEEEILIQILNRSKPRGGLIAWDLSPGSKKVYSLPMEPLKFEVKDGELKEMGS